MDRFRSTVSATSNPTLVIHNENMYICPFSSNQNGQLASLFRIHCLYFEQKFRSLRNLSRGSSHFHFDPELRRTANSGPKFYSVRHLPDNKLAFQPILFSYIGLLQCFITHSINLAFFPSARTLTLHATSWPVSWETVTGWTWGSKSQVEISS